MKKQMKLNKIERGVYKEVTSKKYESPIQKSTSNNNLNNNVPTAINNSNTKHDSPKSSILVLTATPHDNQNLFIDLVKEKKRLTEFKLSLDLTLSQIDDTMYVLEINSKF